MRLRSLLGRATWNLVDQAVVSLSNAVLTFFVARSVDPTTFGGFAIAFTVFAVLVGLSRASATAPLPVRFSDAVPERFRIASSAAVGTSLSLGTLGGLGCVGIGLAVGGVGGQAVLALGLVLPGLLVQDAWRQVFFAAGRPAAAALNSAVWAVAQFVAVAALISTDNGTVLPLVLAWGGAALAAALLGVRQGRTVPRPDRTSGWVREHRDLTRYVVAEFAAQQGAMQGTLLLVGVIGSLAAIGTMRGALVVLGLTSILTMAAVSFALPEFSRRRATLTERQWFAGAFGLSVFVAGVGVLWGALFLLLPAAIGRSLLGDTWDGVAEVLVAAIVSQALLTAGVGPSTMIRAMDRASVTFWRHAVMSPVILACGITGVVLAGAEGAFWGFAVAYGLGQPLWWFLLRREVRAMVARRGASAETDFIRRPDIGVQSMDPFFGDLGLAQMQTMLMPVVVADGRHSYSRAHPPARPGSRPTPPPGRRPPAGRPPVPPAAPSTGPWRPRPPQVAPPPGWRPPVDRFPFLPPSHGPAHAAPPRPVPPRGRVEPPPPDGEASGVHTRRPSPRPRNGQQPPPAPGQHGHSAANGGRHERYG